ncbi:MAG: PKD domain-containing protein [Patulibacter minatonensis]
MLRRARSAFALMATVLAAALPAGAQAANYCVGAPGGSCDGGSYALSLAGFGQALSDASGAAGSNVLRIAEGTITGITSVNLAGGVVIDGAGRGRTVLESAQLNGAAFSASGTGNGFSDLTLRSAAITSSASVVNVAGGASITRVDIVEASPQNTNQLVTALALNGSSASDVTVKTNSAFDRGIDMSNAGSLTDVSVTGPGIMGIKTTGAGIARQLDRVTVRGYTTGLVSSSALALFVRDSVFDLGSTTGARGWEIGASDADNVQGARVTIVGRGPNQSGVYVAANSGESPSAELIDSLVDVTPGTSLECVVTNTGTPDLRTTRTAFRTVARDAGCTGTASSILDLTAAPPLYRDAAAKDWRPAASSPVIDAGTTNAPTQTQDLAKGARFVDGNGAGGAAVDLGAYEYQRLAPNGPVISAPSGAVAGAAAAFSASASDPDGDPVTLSWAFGDGGTATGGAPTHTYAAAGSYKVVVTATDVTGRSSTGESTLLVGAAAAPTPSPAATPTPLVGAPELPAPTVGPGTAAPSATAKVTLVKAPKGTTRRSQAGFTVGASTKRTVAQLTAENAASLRITLTRLRLGRRSGGACTTGARRGATCTVRTAVKGTASVTPRAGRFSLGFGGTFAGTRLRAGAYEVRVVPVNAAGAAGPPPSSR